MGTAYVPGLKVTEFTEMRLERRLPLKGEVVVERGQRVSWDTTVARTFLPGAVEMLNVAQKLGLEPAEVPECMLVKEGEQVQKGQPLARSKGFFGFFKTTLDSPITGCVEAISNLTGQVTMRAPAVPVEIKAYVDGVVDEVLPQEGVVVHTCATFIQGIFGIGGETSGELVMVATDPAAEMKVSDIKPEHRGKVLVGGGKVTGAVLQEAVKQGVSAIIVGGIDDQDLKEFLGYDLGVAITGSEEKGLTLVITEGFGPIRMAERTFCLLGKRAGRRASVSGATQIRAGVIRPEVIIPLEESDRPAATQAAADQVGLDIGAWVRIIRQPHFGALARVVGLPVELTRIPTEALVRVAELELEDGQRLVLPRANLELIETA
jgi:hypothetical protein